MVKKLSGDNNGIKFAVQAFGLDLLPLYQKDLETLESQCCLVLISNDRNLH